MDQLDIVYLVKKVYT